MEDRVIDSEHMNFSGKNFARLSYEMLFEEQEPAESAPEEEEIRSPDQLISEQEVVERLRKVEEEWKERLEREKKETAGAAFKKGKKKGREEALSSLKERTASIRKALDEADRQIARMLEELKPSMATMVFDLAEKVIRVPLENERVRARVKEEIEDILHELEEGINVKVEVSPEDFEMVEKMVNGRGGYVDLKASGELSSGEFVVDTRCERIVKRFNKILDDFREAVALTADRSRNDAA